MIPVLPVQQVSDRVWLKRDDLHVPFDDTPMNGAKTYQCLNLIERHLDLIRDRYEGTIYSDNFVTSPQGPIVARVAREFGLRCIIPVASSSLESVRRWRSMQLVEAFGGEVEVVCRMGLGLKHKAPKVYGDRYFRVKFGMSSDLPSIREAVINPVRDQVEAFVGLPTEDMTLVVPVGSGIVFSALLIGLAERGVRFRRIVGVEISGLDRRPLIEQAVEQSGHELPSPLLEALGCPTVPEFDLVIDHRYAYARMVERSIEGVELDTQYEAKAWAWVERTRLLDESPILFYIVGNANCLR